MDRPIEDMFSGTELELLFYCLNEWANERSQAAIRRAVEVEEIRRKLLLRIREGSSE